jgi:hypothetical protein
MLVVIGLWTFLRAWLLGSTAIALENLALRHQLAVLQRSVRRPRLLRWDRILFSEAACQEKSSLVVSAPSLSSSCVRTTNARVSGSLCEVCHPSLRAVSGE